MTQSHVQESIIRQKAEFVQKNAVKLYYMRGTKGVCGSSTIEESLVSILLSDKPLMECGKYKVLNNILNSLNDEDFHSLENENYALKVIFSAARIVNTFSTEKNSEILRDKLRQYTKYIDNHINVSSNEITFDVQKVNILQK